MEKETDLVDITQLYESNSQATLSESFAPADIVSRYKKLRGHFDNIQGSHIGIGKNFRKKLKSAVKQVKKGDLSKIQEIEEHLDNELSLLYNRATVINRIVSDFEAEKNTSH